jgi:DNA-binding transcriptional LysR family regulator
MDLRHLRYFVVAAQTGNLHRAAERLRIVQPALSRQIQALEEELGTPIFERDAHGVALLPVVQLRICLRTLRPQNPP